MCRQSLGFFNTYSFMSTKVTAPSQKGIKATTNAINQVLEGSAQLQMCLNLYSTAASDNSIPIDQQAWREAADLMAALNRLMHGEKARLEHLSDQVRVRTYVSRTVKSIRRQVAKPALAS